MSTYIVTRAHGLNTRLLPPEFYEAATSMKNLSDITNLLSPTEYSKYIERGEEISVENLHNAYLRVFSDRLNLISTIPIGGDLAEFRDYIILRYEIENIIKVLLGIKARKKFHEIQKYLIPGLKYKINYQEMYREGSIERALQYIKSRGFKVSEKAYELYAKYDTVLPLEKDLIKYNYRLLLDKAGKLGRETKMLVKKLIGLESEIENVFVSVAPLLYNYSVELTEFLILPFTFRINLQNFLSVVNSKNPREVLDKFSVYNEIVVPLLERNEFKAKLAALKYLSDFLYSYKILSSMLPPYLLYLVKKMEYEYKHLIYITYSIYYGSKPELSKNMIIR